MLPIDKGIDRVSKWGNVAVFAYRGLWEWRIWFWLVRCWPDTCIFRHRRVPPRVYIGSSPRYQVALLWSSRLLWFFSPPGWASLFCDLTTSPENNLHVFLIAESYFTRFLTIDCQLSYSHFSFWKVKDDTKSKMLLSRWVRHRNNELNATISS